MKIRCFAGIFKNVSLPQSVQRDHPSNDKGPQNSLNAAIKDRQISKQTHESMSQIFKLISDKETSKEGVARLYEFKVANPEF